MSKFLGVKLEEFHWGMIIAQKFMWIINLTILFKIFDLPKIYYFVITPVIVIFVWFTGYIIKNTGIKSSFIRSYYEGSGVEHREKNDTDLSRR